MMMVMMMMVVVMMMMMESHTQNTVWYLYMSHDFQHVYKDIFRRFKNSKLSKLHRHIELLKMLNKLRDIKLIACDMDGTFLDPEHKIRDQNLHAVSEVRKRGLEFIIVRVKTVGDDRKRERTNTTNSTTGHRKKPTISTGHCRKILQCEG